MENRHLLNVSVGGQNYRVLLDSGAMVSLVGPEIAERYKSRLIPFLTVVRGVNGSNLKVLGKIKLSIEIDGRVKLLEFRAVAGIEHQIIFGIDFFELWRIEVKFAERVWRIADGEYREFADRDDDAAPINIECSGISKTSEIERDRVTHLVESIVPPPSSTLGFTRIITHSIDVQDSRPIKCAPRRMSPKMLEIAQDEVRKMLAEGVIEPSTSEWCSAPVIVKKSGGGHRFCIDFRDLNKVTRPDAYPMPSVDSILDRLRDARYISKIDLRQAYFQINLDEKSKKYTAFAIQGSGLWQFRRMAFGLINGPATPDCVR